MSSSTLAHLKRKRQSYVDAMSKKTATDTTTTSTSISTTSTDTTSSTNNDGKDSSNELPSRRSNGSFCSPTSTSPSYLTDLSPPLLSSLLTFIDCRSLAHLTSTSHHIHDTCMEHISITSTWSNALSTNRYTDEAINECIQRCLSQCHTPPNIAFVFYSPLYGQATPILPHLLPHLPSDIHIVGCHGDGIIGMDMHGIAHETESTRAISLTLARLADATIHSFFISEEDLEKYQSTYDHIATWIPEATGLDPSIPWNTFVLMSTPCPSITYLVHSLYRMYPHALIVGGHGSGAQPKHISLMQRSPGQTTPSLHTGGVVGLALCVGSSVATLPSSLPSSLSATCALGFASRGCIGLGETYRIAAAEGDLIIELQGSDGSANATHILAHVLRTARAAGTVMGSMFVGLSMVPDPTDGFVLCDVEQMYNYGIQIDLTPVAIQPPENANMSDNTSTTTSTSTSASTSTSTSTLSDMTDRSPPVLPTSPPTESSFQLEGQYMRFFVLHPTACAADLAERMATLPLCKRRVNSDGMMIDIKSDDIMQDESIEPIGVVTTKSQPSHHRALGCLLFRCAGRGADFYGRPNVDSRIVTNAFNNMCVAGFACNGEIGPPARSLQVEATEVAALAAAARAQEASTSTSTSSTSTSTSTSTAASSSSVPLPISSPSLAASTSRTRTTSNCSTDSTSSTSSQFSYWPRSTVQSFTSVCALFAAPNDE